MKNIKKVLSTGIILSILFVPIFFLRAEDDSGTTTKVKGDWPVTATSEDGVGGDNAQENQAEESIVGTKGIDNKIQRKENRLGNIENQISSTTASTSAKKIKRLDKRAQNLNNQINKLKERLDSREFKIIGQLENISNRIETRITLLEGQGVVLTDAKDTLAQANTKISEAKSEEANLNSLLATATATSTAMTTSKNKIKTLIKDSYSLLQTTVKQINQAIPKNSESTSTSN